MQPEQTRSLKSTQSQKQTNTVNLPDTGKVYTNKTCLFCKQKGHISKYCSAKMSKNEHNLFNGSDSDLKGDKKVSINGEKLYCFFDSGSSVNTINRTILNRIPHSTFKKLSPPVKIILLNKEKLRSSLSVELTISFENRTVRDNF